MQVKKGGGEVNGFPFTTQEALGLLGISAPSNGYIKCPYCMSSNRPLHFKYETSQFRCNKNSKHFGNILTFYKDMAGLKDTKEAFRDICDRLHRNPNDIVTTPYQQPKEKAEDKPIIDYDKRDKVNRKMTRVLRLSEKNTQNLLDRGFVEEEIKSFPYVTIPEMDYKEKLDLISRLGFNDYEGVPPFYVSKKGNWFINLWRGGIMVPYYDIYGRLTAWQIRVDDDSRKTDENGQLEPKYIYPTSRDKNHGTASSQTVGYCCDYIQKDDGTKIINIKNGVMTLIEGGMKGSLYHFITGVPTIVVPGVNCLNVLKEELPKLRDLGVYRIQIGYDMDRVMNINVWEALLAIKKLIESYGIEAPLMEWSNEIVHLNGSHDIMDCDTTFVFNKKTMLTLLDDQRKFESNENYSVANSITPIEQHFERLKKVGVEQIFFAFKNATEAKENESYKLYTELLDLCNKHNLPCTPVFWDLKLKGLDDRYAYEVRGVIPK